MEFTNIDIEDIFNSEFYKKFTINGFMDCLSFIIENIKDIEKVYNNIDKFIKKFSSEKKVRSEMEFVEIIKNGLYKDYFIEYLLESPGCQNTRKILTAKFNFTFSDKNITLEDCTYNVCKTVLTYYYNNKSNQKNTKDKKMVNDVLNELIIKNHQNDNLWYRGQCDFSWQLIPSFLRDIDDVITSINKDYLYRDYTKKKLIEKYNKVFYPEIYEVSYEFLSFMQHAVSYSPFLDFTDSPIIATSFALSNNNKFNNYYSNEASIFELECKEISDLSEISPLSYHLRFKPSLFYVDTIEKMQKVINNIKIKMCETYIISDYFNKVPTIMDVLNSITPNVIMIDLPTNDRMKYQQGKFVLFDNFVCVNGNIFYELNKNFRITKIKIEKRSKDKIREEIRKNHQPYTITNLLDPYNYFNE
ncbi:MAG: FRG domain-containing protein [Peptostreptococcaceae bacterium]